MTNQEFSEKIESSIQKGKAFLHTKFKLSSHDAEDCVQNSAVKAYKNLSSFNAKSQFDTWFLTIVRNEALNFLSKKNLQCVELQEALSVKAIEEESNKDYISLVEQGLAHLNEKNKIIIEMSLKDCYSTKEMSEILNIPMSSVRTRLFYAKKKLKSIIKRNAYKSNIQLPNH